MSSDSHSRERGTFIQMLLGKQVTNTVCIRYRTHYMYVACTKRESSENYLYPDWYAQINERVVATIAIEGCHYTTGLVQTLFML